MNKNSVVLYLLVALWLLFTVPAIYQDIAVNTTYKQTTCTVLNKKINHGIKYYHPFIQLKYSVDTVYTQWAPASRTHTNVRTESYANELLNKYVVTQVIPCWYNPNHPMTVYPEKGYTIEMWIYFISMLGFSLAMTVLLFLNKKLETPSLNIPRNSNDLFAIKENRYTIETIYQGEKPLTADLLPAKFQKLSLQQRQKITEVINKNGRLIALKPFYAKILVGGLVITAVLGLVMTFLDMWH